MSPVQSPLPVPPPLQRPAMHVAVQFGAGAVSARTTTTGPSMS
jgi:hypothetical protein